MAKQPRQMTLFPVRSEEELCKQPFTIKLLNGQDLTVSLKTIRHPPRASSRDLAANAESKPDA